tara:strand:+ start:136 stop:825 length:690 start_codon:yes stop_codon:yes gene_type:complete
MATQKTIALLSGGLDSATAVGIAKEKGHEVIGLSFDYGQRHKKELESAASLAKYFNLIEHHVISIDLSRWGGSSLTDIKEKIPCKGVIQGIIPSTYVPGRNTIFIAIALSLAEAKFAQNIVLGINALDYSGYPDCRPDYINVFQKLANLSSKAGREGKGIKLWSPLIHLTKSQIIREALRLGIPINQTWSCYQGEKYECGLCDSCRIRNLALEEVGVKMRKSDINNECI